MATATRQPFAPLDGARLQTLTSLKNRQNAISNAPVKRKASEVDDDDFENVDPILFSKRSKGGDSLKPSAGMDYFKPSAFVLTKAASTPSIPQPSSPPQAASTSSRPRSFLQPKSPAAKLNTSISSPSLTAPAGRSPTRGSKRIGILSKRRTARVAPPAFGLGGAGGAAPFSLDAALKGTIPSYGGRSASSSISSALSSGSLVEPELKSSWFFDIHEDTPEQEMTNLLQHSTCTLDISSDEESEQRASRERAEGRDKENIPPADDVSQTSRAMRGTPVSEDDMMVEKMRGPLAEMNAADYYAKGCDDTSVVIVPGDDDEGDEQHLQQAEPVVEQAPALAGIDTSSFEFAPELKLEAAELSVDAIMGKEELGDKAAVLAPIDGAGECFELWESGSAKDDAEAPASPAPAADAVALA